MRLYMFRVCISDTEFLYCFVCLEDIIQDVFLEEIKYFDINKKIITKKV